MTEKLTLKQHFNNFRQTVLFVWKGAKWLTVANALLTVIQGVLPLAMLYLMKLVIDSIIFAINSADKDEAYRKVLIYLILTGVVYIINAFTNSLVSLVKSYQSQLASDYMFDIIHNKAVSLDLEYYENHQYQDILYRARMEAPTRPTRIVNGLAQILQNTISLFLIAGLLVTLHWSVALILIFATLPSVLVRVKFSGIMYEWNRRKTPIERQASYFSWLISGIMHAKEIRLFDLGSLFQERFHSVRKELRVEKLKLDKRRTVNELITQVSSAIAIFGAYSIIGYTAVKGNITMGSVVMFFMAFQRGQAFLQEILSSLASLYEDNLFLSNLYEFLALKPTIFNPQKPEKIPQTIQKGIEFENVSFKYPTGTRNVLKNITLSIKKGETIAFIGHNGAGKTTLIKLLCRLYDVNEGNIKIDGIDIRNYEIAELRKLISVVFQDYAHYNLSATENIWFGNPHKQPEKETIEYSAKQAGIHDLISKFANSYETLLGKMFQDGEELSVGEWQKIALARSFFRDSQLVVLDEPTSSLDTVSEYEVFNRFRELAAGKTTIIISHRFSTVNMADKIYVLDKENIIEFGTHLELMQKDGHYAKLFRMQSESYQIEAEK